MVISQKSKIFWSCIFLLPALILYTLFFIAPFLQGIKYSFTDWNGIVPVIPFNINKAEFEEKILTKIAAQNDRVYLGKYYRLDETGQNYNLTNWIKEAGQTRQLNNSERNKLKRILKSAGISAIKYIGWANYQQMFQNDQRFVPRVEKKFLFNEFDDLPPAIKAGAFNKELIGHIAGRDDQSFVLSKYVYDRSTASFRLAKGISEAEADKLKSIIRKYMYKRVFIPGVIGFTLFFTIFNVIFSNLCALTLALILDTKMKTKNVLRSVFFFPNVLSLIIVAFIWSFVIRLILPALTGIDVWLGSPELAPYALLMVTVWQGCGWLMIIYLAGLQTIPGEILEVAEIDGTKWWQRFRYIIAPLLMPAFTICLFFSLSNSLKTFDIIMALTQGGPGYVTTPIVLDIYYNAFQSNLYGYATAKAVLLCLIIMVITGIQLYFMKKREVES